MFALFNYHPNFGDSPTYCPNGPNTTQGEIIGTAHPGRRPDLARSTDAVGAGLRDTDFLRRPMECPEAMVAHGSARPFGARAMRAAIESCKRHCDASIGM